MFSLTAVAITFIGSFIATFLIVPPLIKRMHKRGLTGKDMNKLGSKKVAELGGIGVLLGFSFGIMLAIAFYSYLDNLALRLNFLLAAFSTIALIGLIGIADDLIGWRSGIRKWQHALFPLFAALPLMALKAGFTTMSLPFIGSVALGIYYSLIIVPIGVTGASNAFNMLAGLNGLEAGLGILCCGTMLLVSIFNGEITVTILMAAMLGALLAFLYYNWFPGKVFGGDSLTLMIGAAMASAAIIGNMEKVGIALMVLFFIELMFKAKHKFQSECFGIPQKDGTLKADPRGGSLTQWVMRKGKFTEPQVTGIILGMQAVVCIIVFGLYYAQMLV